MAAYISEYASIPYISSKNALDGGSSQFSTELVEGIDNQLILPSTGFIDCMNKDVSFFNIKCMLAVFGEFRTNIFSETNVGYAPSTIE